MNKYLGSVLATITGTIFLKLGIMMGKNDESILDFAFSAVVIAASTWLLILAVALVVNAVREEEDDEKEP
jgi:putative effector of murein hydrolase LrgA (UPF0299 family)